MKINFYFLNNFNLKWRGEKKIKDVSFLEVIYSCVLYKSFYIMFILYFYWNKLKLWKKINYFEILCV